MSSKINSKAQKNNYITPQCNIYIIKENINLLAGTNTVNNVNNEEGSGDWNAPSYEWTE